MQVSRYTMAENSTHLRSLQDRINILKLFYLSKMSCSETIRKYRTDFPTKPPPARTTIYRIVDAFEETGSIEPRKRTRRRTSRTEERIELVRVLAESQQTSSRNLAAQSSIPRTSVQRILHQDLGLKPYRLRLVQKLSEDDELTRVVACEKLLDSRVFQKPPLLFFSDEANFFTDGFVNRHNCIIYDYARPDKHIVSRDLSAAKVCVWGALSSTKVIGPYFFEGTVNKDSYCEMLNTFAIPEIQASVGHHQMSETFFMQDGASSHFSLPARAIVREVFGDRGIGRGLSIEWPARSPDLTPADYFLWGYLKDIVYQGGQPGTIEDLKDRITQGFNHIRTNCMDHVSKAVRSFQDRLHRCIEMNGCQLDALDKATKTREE